MTTALAAPFPEQQDPVSQNGEVAAGLTDEEAGVMRLTEVDRDAVVNLLADYDLTLVVVADGKAIPGSYWGEPEAGLIGHCVYARSDTPVHSLLHEACHLIVQSPERRAAVHTNATDSIDEENAVCVLQVLLGDRLPGVGADRILDDMDRWGYTFRLGSARAYFEHDADDAFNWLRERGLHATGSSVRCV